MASKSPMTEEERFDIEHVADKNPVSIFRKWSSEYMKHNDYPLPVVLATSTLEGVPSSRVVLLRSFDENGFLFFCSYLSRKGRELEANARASLTFFCLKTLHQVRIEGTVEKLSEEENAEFFDELKTDYRISCHATENPRKLQSKDDLKRIQLELEEKFKGKKIEKPAFWGGYKLTAQTYAFWQGHSSRLNDIFHFKRLDPDEEADPQVTKPAANGWFYERWIS